MLLSDSILDVMGPSINIRTHIGGEGSSLPYIAIAYYIKKKRGEGVKIASKIRTYLMEGPYSLKS